MTRVALHHSIFKVWAKEKRLIIKKLQEERQRVKIVNSKLSKLKKLAKAEKGQLIGEGISSKEIKHLARAATDIEGSMEKDPNLQKQDHLHYNMVVELENQ